LITGKQPLARATTSRSAHRICADRVAAFLMRLDCDELQGTLISVPLALADFERWARADRGAASVV
jgi:EAL domain-containing protein (putative c-di-GMP-specific phosphodiesterase class I)